MREAAFNQTHRPNKTAIAVVVLIHATALTALALAKSDMVREAIPRITLIDLKAPLPDPPPPPKPVEQVEPQVEPQHVSVVTAPDRVIVTPVHFDDIVLPERDLGRTDDIYSKPGPTNVETPPPPPPPEPKKIEPARAKANLASYVSDSDYPAAAQRAEEQGTARFRLSVGADGRVTACTITGSSGSSSLDAATCRIMKSRARFTPARNSDGQATGDTVANAIRWVLPE